MKKKTKILLSILAILCVAAVVWAGTVSRKPYGVSTPYWYGYSAGAISDYYLAHPTLTANDTATANAATQTLENKTLASPVITGSAVFEGTTSDDYETSLGVDDPTADRTITLPDYTGAIPIVIGQYGTSNTCVSGTSDVPSSTVTPADGWWVAGKALEWTCVGNMTGTNAAKHFILYVDDAAIIDITTPATAAGDFVFTATVFQTDESISGVTQILYATLFCESGVSETQTDYATDTSLFSGTSPFKLQVTSGNAGDTVYTKFLKILHWFKS